MQKNYIIGFIILVIIIGGWWYLTQPKSMEQNNGQTAFDIQGMKVEILEQGSGAEAKNGDLVTVDYVGTLLDGTKFDSSIDRGQPFQFNLGAHQVIQGWDLGVAGMKVGEKRKLTIPPQLGYGASGAGAVIPPNAVLVFEVTLHNTEAK